MGQVWRGGPGQARLAAALAGMETRPLDQALGRADGALFWRSARADVVEVAVAALAADGDIMITEDAATFPGWSGPPVVASN